MTHLDSLNLRLSNERMRLASAKSAKERALRTVWVAQIEREIQGEKSFIAAHDAELSADEIMAELDL